MNKHLISIIVFAATCTMATQAFASQTLTMKNSTSTNQTYTIINDPVRRLTDPPLQGPNTVKTLAPAHASTYYFPDNTASIDVDWVNECSLTAPAGSNITFTATTKENVKAGACSAGKCATVTKLNYPKTSTTVHTVCSMGAVNIP